MFKLFSLDMNNVYEISEKSLKSVASKTAITPIKGYVHEGNIPLWFRTKSEAEQVVSILKHNTLNKFDWTRIQIKEGEESTFILDILGKSNMLQFRCVFNLVPDETFTMGHASLNAIADKAKVSPIKGYVHEYNIPIWFSTQNEAELFLKYLKQNFEEKFDWTRVELEEREDKTYLVNILSKANMKEFRKLFDLQAEPHNSPNIFLDTNEIIYRFK